MTQRDRWAKRPAVLRYFAFADELREAASELKWQVPSRIDLEFGMPMPKSWSNRKKLEMDDQPHQQKPDIDNLIKAFLDALCDDDSFVYVVHAAKYWCSEPYIKCATI